MLQKFRFNNAKKNQRVILAKDLPVGMGFGNKSIIKQDLRGDITSNGFENGRLKVKFYSYASGVENVEFNEISATSYLFIDIY